MEYKTVAEAKDMPGLRLVLTQGVPGPWGECAKNVLFVKRIHFIPVAQAGGAENADLKAWTGVRNAPVAVFNSEPARDRWLDILLLAERINPDIPLLPTDPEERAQVVGLGNELAGEWGLAWCRRAELLGDSSAMGRANPTGEFFRQEYGITPAVAVAAPTRTAQILNLFARRLKAQRAAGSNYLVGKNLTAADVCWASFAGMVKPLPDSVSPMPGWLRSGYESVAPVIKSALDPILFEHRDFIYKNHLKLPLDF